MRLSSPCTKHHFILFWKAPHKPINSHGASKVQLDELFTCLRNWMDAMREIKKATAAEGLIDHITTRRAQTSTLLHISFDVREQKNQAKRMKIAEPKKKILSRIISYIFPLYRRSPPTSSAVCMTPYMRGENGKASRTRTRASRRKTRPEYYTSRVGLQQQQPDKHDTKMKTISKAGEQHRRKSPNLSRT